MLGTGSGAGCGSGAGITIGCGDGATADVRTDEGATAVGVCVGEEAGDGVSDGDGPGAGVGTGIGPCAGVGTGDATTTGMLVGTGGAVPGAGWSCACTAVPHGALAMSGMPTVHPEYPGTRCSMLSRPGSLPALLHFSSNTHAAYGICIASSVCISVTV